MPYGTHRPSHDDEPYSTYSDGSRRLSDSEQSEQSYLSDSTAPTEHDYTYTRTKPQYQHYEAYEVTPKEDAYYNDESEDADYDPRASVETYASTVPSISVSEEPMPEFQPPSYQPDIYSSDATPTTPADFAELFPSTRRLTISHDDSTSDGNMNLRVNTQVKSSKGRIQNMILFHLRMYDLKNREFSLRRYDRDSGREVCHTVRKYRQSAAEGRPGFQRSISNAIASIRSKSDNKSVTRSSFNRSDSGYESIHQAQQLKPMGPPTSTSGASKALSKIPTNTTRLEFSNYAQVEVKRRGTKLSKRYEFEYWGANYYWKQVTHKDSQGTEVSYHLYHSGHDQPLAHIMPEPLGASQRHEEQMKGGWVPPCSMWISDERICQMQNDVSDVVIASGLVALVDGCIKTHFRSKQSRQMTLPLPMLNKDIEFVGPKRLITGVLSRPSTSHGTPTHRQTPLRQTSYDR